jgi:hypothetical protein
LLRWLRLLQARCVRFARPVVCALALSKLWQSSHLLAPGSFLEFGRSLVYGLSLLTWHLLVYFLLRWLLRFAMPSVVLVSSGWFHQLLQRRFHLLA